MTKQARSLPEIYFWGEAAVTLQAPAPVSLEQQQKIWQLARLAEAIHGVADIVPGMNNLTLRFQPQLISRQYLQQWLSEQWHAKLQQVVSGRHLQIGIHYGGEFGPDLEHVAHHCGMSVSEVIALHSSATYTVFFLGFQPGFAYLGGMPEALATPRRTSPRARVPAGSVAIGGEQTGIYPNASPGGWQIIGHTDTVLFDPKRSPASYWLPGDKVSFVALENEYA